LTGLAGLLGIRTIQHLKQSRLKKISSCETLESRDFVFFVILGSSFVVAHMMVIGGLHDH